MATNARGTLNLPDILRDHRRDLERALTEPIAGAWPEDQAYTNAIQPEAIARVLVDAIHVHLVNARITYLFREKMKHHDKVTLAKASRAGGKIEFLADVDLLIEVNWTYWRQLSSEQRIALMDHELQHFAMNDNGDGYTVMAHDIEEFSAIVRRWGLWRMDLKVFARAIEHGPQLVLFDEHGAAHA